MYWLFFFSLFSSNVLYCITISNNYTNIGEIKTTSTPEKHTLHFDCKWNWNVPKRNFPFSDKSLLIYLSLKINRKISVELIFTHVLQFTKNISSAFLADKLNHLYPRRTVLYNLKYYSCNIYFGDLTLNNVLENT